MVLFITVVTLAQVPLRKLEIVVPLNQNLLIIVHVNSLSDSLSVSRTMCSGDTQKAKKAAAVGGREGGRVDDGRLWFGRSVLEVKYDWLVHSWADMPPLQLKSVNSMCTDWAEWRVKPVVTATWQILWLAGQATAQVEWYKQTVYWGIQGVCDTACPCLTEYAYMCLYYGCMRETLGCIFSSVDVEHNKTWQRISVL